jgi:hypothetical protein
MPLQATSGAASYDAFGGGVPFEPTYIEQIFQTWLYTGNGSTQTITNGIDLAGRGGLVWVKTRSSADNHGLYDTARGVQAVLISNNTAAQSTVSGVTAFNANGFALGSDSDANGNNKTTVSWTFREQPKFFDVVTYTGNGAAGQTINHNLGSVPGFMVVKRTNTTGDWAAYHRSLGATQIIFLNDTQAAGATVQAWNNTEPTSTQFTVGVGYNASGSTYVAYLFAHNAGGFGLTGTDNVISCGSYTGTGSTTNTVTLGYEPQWVMIKRSAGGTGDWRILDNMRGMPDLAGSAKALYANLTDAEDLGQDGIAPTATGFKFFATGAGLNASGSTYIYIAIRRGPMKTPTTGTSVFNAITRTGTGSAATISNIGFAPDLVYPMCRNDIANKGGWVDKLRGASRNLTTNFTDAESSNTQGVTAFGNTSISVGTSSFFNSALNYVNYFFQRAPSFMDVVCYTGTGSTPEGFNHNLGVTPEMVIVKSRSSGSENWRAWVINYSFSQALSVNSSSASTSGGFGGAGLVPATDTLFYVSASSTPNNMNEAGTTYVAYLFASCPGVSKVGTYTGTGALQTINCGFTGGARFVLIKRKDGSGDWFVWDSARGITSGNDPYLLLNSTAAEVTSTNFVDTTAVGFQITAAAPAAINANGGTFIFLAIA